jgi:Rieske Fe-S protein
MTELTDLTTRRAVLGGVAAVGAGAVLAACGSDEPTDSTGGGGDADGGGGDGGSGGGEPSGALATVDEVPVGGGTVFQKEKIVVTQPTEGDFKAFSAVCQHQGCTVGSVNGDIIQCNCHGSQYSATDGSVKKGPTTKPLPKKKVSVDGDNIVVS